MDKKVVSVVYVRILKILMNFVCLLVWNLWLLIFDFVVCLKFDLFVRENIDLDLLYMELLENLEKFLWVVLWVSILLNGF